MNDNPPKEVFCHSVVIRVVLITFMAMLVAVEGLAAPEDQEPEETGPIAVVYPNVKSPYLEIFKEIIEGCESQSGQSVMEFAIAADEDIAPIIKKLDAEKLHKVVVLGRAGYMLGRKLPPRFSVVSGALPLKPNGVPGVSLISDPEILFEYLTVMAPSVKRIHVVYSQSSQWVIDKAKTAADSQKYSLKAYLVQDTAQAVNTYFEVLEQADPRLDALWLPLDRVSSHDKVILPLILKEAWTRGLVVFSSKPSHARRGALFSTYPDNVELGKNLVRMLDRINRNPEDKGVSMLQDMQLVVNMRTAAHLGLNYSSEQRQKFKLTFPD